MRTKHLCVLIHILIKGEAGPLNMWIRSVICLLCLPLLCCLVCSLESYDNKLGKSHFLAFFVC